MVVKRAALTGVVIELSVLQMVPRPHALSPLPPPTPPQPGPTRLSPTQALASPVAAPPPGAAPPRTALRVASDPAQN